MTPSNRPSDERSLIQRQFGTHAEAYVQSRDHRGDATLDHMVALLDLAPQARVLDLATGGGHTALALAPLAGAVVASDLTYPMLRAARRSLHSNNFNAVTYVQADVHSLPWQANVFEAVTCRVAAHHFADVPLFVRECARLLRPGGRLALIDNITPSKVAHARYINAYEKLRDPSHGWEYSSADWQSFFKAAGLTVEHVETSRMAIRFEPWVARMSVPELNRGQLRALLQHAPGIAREWLNPREEEGNPTFDLGKLLIVGQLD